MDPGPMFSIYPLKRTISLQSEEEDSSKRQKNVPRDTDILVHDHTQVTVNAAVGPDSNFGHALTSKSNTDTKTTSTLNTGQPTAIPQRPILLNDPINISYEQIGASGMPRATLAAPSAIYFPSDVGLGERAVATDASVCVLNQGVTYNISGSANAQFLYGSHINQGHQKHCLGAAIRNLRRSHNAEFDMVADTNRGPCTPGTRTIILKDLVNWCNLGTISLYWMDGMAGTGKTTIAYSLCKLLADANLLGASFFCSRSLPDCRDSNIIIPTIAFQLAKKYASFAEALAEALEKDEDIFRRGLDVQLRELLIKPWNARKAKLPPHTVIILDALDECNDGHSTFLRAISDYAGKLPFKLMVTSRPEPSIRSILLAKDPETLATFILHEVEESLVEEDIARFVESQLKKRLPLLLSSVARLLSKQCGKFFIYAATLCRFILDEDGDHLERLRLLLSQSPSDARERAVQPIDALYIQILRRAFSNKKLRSEIDGIKLVFHTVVCAREPLTQDAIASLWELTVDEVEGRLKSLRSLVFIPQAIGQPLSTFHASLPDFMMDDSRSGQFHCQPCAFNLEIVKRCLDLMKRELRQNICHVEEHLPNNSIQPNTIDKHIGPGLRYASIYWLEHWRLCDRSERQTVISSIYDFLATGLVLHWFECLSLIGRLVISIQSLKILQGTVDENPEVAAPVHDLLRFIQYFYSDIETNATLVYPAMLTWIPLQSPLQKHYTSLRQHTPRMLCGLPMTWPRLERGISIHSETVYSVAISQDGQYIISGSKDRTVRIWNVHSHIEECVLGGHTDEINSVAFSGDGSWAVSGSDDGTVRVWDIATCETTFTLESGSGVCAVAISPDKKRIASGHQDSIVRIWDTMDGHLICSHRGHTGSVFSVIFTPDGTWLISGSRDGTAQVWNTKTGKAEYTLRGHMDYVRSVACSPHGDKIVTGSDDKTARLWDKSGKELHVLRAHSNQVRSVAFMPDGKRVITGSNDRTLRVWDVASGDTVYVFTRLANAIRSVAVFPDGLKIALSSSKTISIWSLKGEDIIGGEERSEGVPAPNVEAKAMAFSANGRRVLLLPSLRILDTATLEEKVVLGSDSAEYFCGALTTLGDGVAASTGNYDELSVVSVWELTDNDTVANHFTLLGHTDLTKSVSFSHDGRQLVSGSYDRTARVWDVATGNQVHALKHPSAVYGVAFSHDNAQIVSAANPTVHVWNAKSGEQLHQFNACVYSVAFSANDHHIITSIHGTISIYDSRDFHLEHTYEGYRYWMIMNDDSSYVLSDDDQWICYSPHFSVPPRRLLWISSQCRPTLTIEYLLRFWPFSSGPLFTPSSTGVQVCLPRRDGLVTFIIPRDA